LHELNCQRLPNVNYAEKEEKPTREILEKIAAIRGNGIGSFYDRYKRAIS